MVSQSWISKLVARYHRECETAFEPRSRRPHATPGRLPEDTVALIVALRAELAGKGLDHGPQTVAWHLAHHHNITIAVSTIHRHLAAAGLITPTPQKTRRAAISGVFDSSRTDQSTTAESVDAIIAVLHAANLLDP